MSLAPLRTVLVGCGPMGRGHGRTVAALEDYALPGFELLMAIHESARLGRRVDLPLQQDRYPLELRAEAADPAATAASGQGSNPPVV